MGEGMSQDRLYSYSAEGQMQTDRMIQPLGGKDCVTGERIEVVHIDDCRKIELEGLETARELSQATRDLQDAMQTLGEILAPGGGIHIGDVPDMAKRVAELVQGLRAGPTRRLTDRQILDAAIRAADSLDATRVNEMTGPNVWKATTIFEGDAGLIRFGRFVEELLTATAEGGK